MPANRYRHEVIVDVSMDFAASHNGPVYLQIPDIRAVVSVSRDDPQDWHITGLEFEYLTGRFPKQTKWIYTATSDDDFPLYSAFKEQLEHRFADVVDAAVARELEDA